MFEHSAMMQEDDLVCEAARLAQVMGHHNHFDAKLSSLKKVSLNSQGRSRVEVCGWLVKK